MVYYLGIPAKTIYRSTEYTSGFTDVHAIVERPDGQQMLVPMTEMDAPFLGIYQGILNTSPDDPVGDYIVMTMAPSDGRRDVTRMSFYPQPASQASVDALALLVRDVTEIIEVLLL